MLELIDILKYTIFYKKYKQPILNIISEEQKSIIELTKDFFSDRDILNLENLYFTSKYSSIILDNIRIPDSLHRLLNETGTIYFFTKDPATTEKKLSIQFKYIKIDKITPSFKLIKDINLTQTIKFESKDSFIYLVRASFQEIKEIDYNIEISSTVINSFIKNIIEENLRDYDINEKIKKKQILLKKTISELFYKYRELENKNKKRSEISIAEKIENFEKESDNDELHTLYNNLIIENNSNISRISHLEFDLNELLQTKVELESTIEEIETLFQKTDENYQKKFIKLKEEKEREIDIVKEEKEKIIEKLKKENKKSKKNIALLISEVKRLRKT